MKHSILPLRTAHTGQSFPHFQSTCFRYSADVSHEGCETRRHAEKRIELDQRNPFANLTMGRTDWLKDFLEGAARWLARILKLCPNSSFALYNRPMIDALPGDRVTAEEHSGRAMLLSRIDPEGPASRHSRPIHPTG